MEIDGLLSDAKKQLHEEANYIQEAEYQSAFYKALGKSEKFAVPKLYPQYSSASVLAMEYMPGEAIEHLGYLDPSETDRIMTGLFELMFQELFELRLMQTDANFANYRFNSSSGKVVFIGFRLQRGRLVSVL